MVSWSTTQILWASRHGRNPARTPEIIRCHMADYLGLKTLEIPERPWCPHELYEIGLYT